uniref:Uncharacterized protein n=1 Tax=viral metagenome TaxID=1070528 RepID=A0A6C0K711_9ZZZZ
MASYNTSQYIDTLTVNTIFTKGANNTNIPAFRVLTTDGNGGTIWMSLSSLQYGAAYHTIKTSVGTYTADQATNATFSLLDGPNAGLINDPTASNTTYLYAKAFGKFDISGGNSIHSYDSVTNTVNSNIIFVGTGGISIKGDPQTNTMFFDGRELPFVSTIPYSFNKAVVYSNVPQNTLIASTNKSLILQAQSASSILGFVGEGLVVIDTKYASNRIHIKLSTLTMSNVSTLLTQNRITFSTFVNKLELSTVYSEFLGSGRPISGESTLSTTYTGIKNVENSISANITRFSTSIANIAITKTELYMSTLFTSSISYAGVRQPFIQYGIALNLPLATSTIPTVILPQSYKNSNYSIQLTYSNTTDLQLAASTIVYATTVQSNSFSIIGTLGKNVYWTTFGDIF